MARNKATQPNIDNSNPALYPDARIRDNDGSGNGTPVNEAVYGDIHEFLAKIMRDSKTNYNDLPDNTQNGYQLYDALMSLAGKNDLIQVATRIDVNTLSVPVKISTLKINETIQFRAAEDSGAYTTIRGVDSVSKTLSVTGTYKAGDLVQIINTQTSVIIFGLYNTQTAPNIIQRLTDIESAFVTYQKIMQIFVGGGGMVFFNRPANQIPAGWAEVVNWRGRFPVGLDISQTEFNTLGDLGIGGAKKVSLTANQLPKIIGNFETISGNGTSPSGVFTRPYANAASISGGSSNFSHIGVAMQFGNNEMHENLPPYKTVLFIEYVG